MFELFVTPYGILTTALIIDFIIGDPEYRYHPIRLIGNLISKSENFFRKITHSQKTNGVIFFIFIFSTVYLVGFGLSSLGWFVKLFIVYSSIAVGDLRKKAMEIKKSLENNNLENARKQVGMIVGRDTENLNEKEIVRGTVETISENIVDGIISPIFFFIIGGAPLMLGYKAINTLDSMVGYKNERYKDFGFFSAKIDDIANYIPARISLLIISLAGILIGKNFVSGIKIGLRDGGKNPSPNSGISEAVVAGLLKIQLGGTNYYFGKKSIKPLIGDKIEELNINHIKEAVLIAYFSAIIIWLFFICISIYMFEL